MLGLISDNTYKFKQVVVDRNISKYLINEIILFLKDNNCTKEELSAICCGRGPGAFTGIRVALSVAKVMSYALKIELYSFSSIIFYGLFSKSRKVISIDDARSYKYYYGLIDKDSLTIAEGIDEDPKVVDYCDLRDDYEIISTRSFINITSNVIDDFSFFDLDIFNKICQVENHYTFKPTYIKKLDSEL